MLKETKIYPGRIVVVERSQDIIVHQFTDLADGSTEQEGVVDHDHPLFPVGKLD